MALKSYNPVTPSLRELVLVDRADGLETIVDAMKGLMASPERRVAIGDAAEKHVRPQSSERYARKLRDFVLDTQDELRRKRRLIVPARDGFSWRVSDLAPEDSAWFKDLTRARRAFLLLDRKSVV